jgi:hypothetical protein
MHKIWNNYNNNKHNINENIQRIKERCNLDYIEFHSSFNSNFFYY